MEEMKIVTPVTVCSYSELTDADRALVDAAKAALPEDVNAPVEA